MSEITAEVKTEAKTATEPEYRKCRSCGRILPISMYSLNHKCRGGHEPRCKECRSKARAYRKSFADFKMSDIPDVALIEELKRRNYTGELRHMQKIAL